MEASATPKISILRMEDRNECLANQRLYARGKSSPKRHVFYVTLIRKQWFIYLFLVQQLEPSCLLSWDCDQPQRTWQMVKIFSTTLSLYQHNMRIVHSSSRTYLSFIMKSREEEIPFTWERSDPKHRWYYKIRCFRSSICNTSNPIWTKLIIKFN